MFFDIFSALCTEKGVSRYKACTDVGLNRAAVAKWKNGAIPTGSTLTKLADYFGVSTDYLLGTEKEKAPTEDGGRQVTDDDIKFALFGGDKDITDAMYEEVKRFAHMVKLREEAERSGNKE